MKHLKKIGDRPNFLTVVIYKFKKRNSGLSPIFPALIVILFAVFVSGCAKDIIIPLDAPKELGETSRALGYVIGDTSTAKERFYQDARKNLDTRYKEAYLHSGTRIKFAQVEKRVRLPGQKEDFVYTETAMVEFTARDMPDFQTIASGPSEHPVWRSVDNVINKVTPYAFGAWAVNSVTGAFEQMNRDSGHNNYVSSSGGDIDFVSQRSNVAIGDDNDNTTVSDINSDSSSSDGGDDGEGSAVCESADDMTSLAGCSCGSCWAGDCGDASLCPKS